MIALMVSPLLGAEGNVEFLAHFAAAAGAGAGPGDDRSPVAADAVAAVVEEAVARRQAGA
jgi:hypothetical protein